MGCHDSNEKEALTNPSGVIKQKYLLHGGIQKHSEIELISSLVLFLVSFVLLSLHFTVSYHIVNTLSFLLAGYKTLFKGIKSILKFQFFNTNTLMTIATLSAFLIQEYIEATGVMLFFRIGGFFQEKAIGKTNQEIDILVQMKPLFVNLKVQNGIEEVSPESIKVGDVIIIKVGERIPLDSVVIKGSSHIDMSAITGESVPIFVKENDSVISGAINQSNLLEVKVSKVFQDSTFQKIIEFVKISQKQKPKTQEWMNRFSRFYTPIIFSLAIAIAIIPPLFFGGSWDIWVKRSIILLVISCPCALVLSIPLSFAVGISHSSQFGILFKNTTTIENLNKLQQIAFDKTGTLTHSKLQMQTLKVYNDVSLEGLLEKIIPIQKLSNHPISLSFIDYFATEFPSHTLPDSVNTDFVQEIKGKGMIYENPSINEKILIGNQALMHENNIPIDASIDPEKLGGVCIFIAQNTQLIGLALFNDTLKKEIPTTMEYFNNHGINTAIISGDTLENVKNIAQKANIKTYFANVLPLDKVKHFTQFKKNKLTAFVGDGINDAPLLTQADIGIAMGKQGSDLAISCADIIINDDNISNIVKAYKIAKKTMLVVKQNITLTLTSKIMTLLLGSFGVINIWASMGIDIGTSIFAALYCLKIKKTSL